MNGYELTSTEDERTNAWMLLAEGIVSEANLAECLEQHSKAETAIIEEATDDDGIVARTYSGQADDD